MKITQRSLGILTSFGYILQADAKKFTEGNSLFIVSYLINSK